MTSENEKGASEDAIRMELRREEDRYLAKKLIDSVKIPSTLTLTPPRASDELSARMHCAIRAVQKQVKWAGERLSEEDWKRLFAATMYGQRVVPSLDGKSFVVLDRRTSRMSSAQKSDLVESIYEFGAARGVIFEDI